MKKEELINYEIIINLEVEVMEEYTLCAVSDTSKRCPKLLLHSDFVEIGEKNNKCRLSKDQWNNLVEIVKNKL